MRTRCSSLDRTDDVEYFRLYCNITEWLPQTRTSGSTRPRYCTNHTSCFTGWMVLLGVYGSWNFDGRPASSPQKDADVPNIHCFLQNGLTHFDEYERHTFLARELEVVR